MSFCRGATRRKPWLPSDDESEPQSEPTLSALESFNTTSILPPSQEHLSRSYSLPPKAVKHNNTHKYSIGKLNPRKLLFRNESFKPLNRDLDRTFTSSEIKEYFLRAGSQRHKGGEGTVRKRAEINLNEDDIDDSGLSGSSVSQFESIKNNDIENEILLKSFHAYPKNNFARNSSLLVQELLACPRFNYAAENEIKGELENEYLYYSDEIDWSSCSDYSDTTINDDLSLLDNETSVDPEIEPRKAVTSNLDCHKSVLQKMEQNYYIDDETPYTNQSQRFSIDNMIRFLNSLDDDINKPNDFFINDVTLKSLCPTDLSNVSFSSTISDSNTIVFDDNSDSGYGKQDVESSLGSVSNESFTFIPSSKIKNKTFYKNDFQGFDKNSGFTKRENPAIIKMTDKNFENYKKQTNSLGNKAEYAISIDSGKVRFFRTEKPVPPHRTTSLPSLNNSPPKGVDSEIKENLVYKDSETVPGSDYINSTSNLSSESIHDKENSNSQVNIVIKCYEPKKYDSPSKSKQFNNLKKYFEKISQSQENKPNLYSNYHGNLTRSKSTNDISRNHDFNKNNLQEKNLESECIIVSKNLREPKEKFSNLISTPNQSKFITKKNSDKNIKLNSPKTPPQRTLFISRHSPTRFSKVNNTFDRRKRSIFLGNKDYC